MNETLKILIGTLSGFIVAFLAEPIKLYFQEKQKRRSIRILLYKEMIENYQALDLAVKLSENHITYNKITVDEAEKEILTGIEYKISNKCYRYITQKETASFYQLREAIDINSVYVLINGLLSISEGQTSFREVRVTKLINTYLDMVAYIAYSDDVVQ